MAMFTYEDILAKINSGNEQNNSNATVRLNAIPLDKSTIYDSYDAAKTYATTAGNAYEGQLIAVKNNGQQEVYVLDSTATDGLRKLASGGSADEIAKQLSELSSQLLSADGIVDQLSAAHNALSTALSTEISAEAIARDEAVKALSTDLSTEISAEAIARDEAVKALSVALSTDVDSLSTALSTEISALNLNANKAVEDLSIALSTDIDALSDALSIEISAETKAREEAIKALEDKLSSAWQFRGVKEAVPNGSEDGKYSNGDVIIVNKDFTDLDGTTKTAAIEYAFDGETWQQLGDESSGVSKFELKTAIDNLSATVSAEIDADVEALSTSLSNTVDAEILALSTALSTEISALNLNANKAVEDLSVALSTDIDSLSTALSTEISAEAIARDEAVKALSVALSTDVDALSADLSGEIDALSTALSTEISALNLNANKAVEDLSVALSTDIDSLSADLSGEIDALSTALSTDLSVEIKAREDNDTFLSTKVDGKIYAQVGDDADPVSVDTMTIHKISAEKYAELLKTEGGIVDTDLYVVSSEYIDGYGEQIKNIADGEEATDGASYGQVMALSTALSTDIKLSVETLEQKIEDAVEGGVEALSTELLTPETGKIPVLDAKVNTISSNLSNEIKALSVALSTDLSAEIEARKAADKAQDDALTEWKNVTGLSAAGAGEDNQVVLWKDVKDITTAMHFRDAITSSTETPIDDALAAISNPVKGDVVIDTATSKEYVYTGSEWRELGDESMYLKNSEFQNFLTGTYQPFTANVDLSVANLCADVSALSDEVAENKSEIEATVAAEVARATAAEKAVDDRVTELSTYTHALSVSQLVWDIDVIDCGNAYEVNG